KATHLEFRGNRAGHDAFKLFARLFFEGSKHRVRRLAESDDDDATLGVQIVEVVPDPQDTPLTADVLAKCLANRGCLERLGENFTRDCSDTRPVRGSRHGQIIRGASQARNPARTDVRGRALVGEDGWLFVLPRLLEAVDERRRLVSVTFAEHPFNAV